MKLGRLHLAGPSAWPDHFLEVDGLVVGLVFAFWRLAFGVEIRRSQWLSGGVWLTLCLGWWCFEAYLDLGGEFEPADDHDPVWDD